MCARRWIALFLAVGSVALVGCDDNGTGSNTQEDPPQPSRCSVDDDCEARESCTVAGECVSKDQCDGDQDCPDGQVCLEDDEGFRKCQFDRCTTNASCEGKISCNAGNVPRCRAGACACESPCPGGCADGSACCSTSASCQPLPKPCTSIICEFGETATVTAAGAWDQISCAVENEMCECLPLADLAIGDIGRQASLAVQQNGQPWIAAYNHTYGDLMLGQVAGRTIDWQFLAGVPTSTSSIEGNINGPRGGRSDPGPHVGRFPSIAVSGSRKWIAYQDWDNKALRMAMVDGSVVEDVLIDDQGETGFYLAAGIAAQGRPFVLYLTRRIDGPTIRQAVLKFAIASTDHPQSTDEWTRRDLLVRSLLTCDDACTRSEVCAFGRCFTPEATCANPCDANQACVQGVCRNVERPSSVRDLEAVFGIHPSVTVGASRVFASYYDRQARTLSVLEIDLNGNPQTLVRAGGNWPVDSGHDVGRFSALDTDTQGRLHIAYVDETENAIRYLIYNNGLLDEDIVVIQDQGGRALRGGPISLSVANDGGTDLAFQNATTGKIMWARRDRTGPFSVSAALETTPGFEGFSLGLAREDNGILHGFGYWLNQSTGRLETGVLVFAP